MKKKLLLALVLSVLLVGCGSTDTTDNAQGTEAPQTQEEQEQEEPPHEHTYTESITTEATCEADGVKTFTCECGDSYTEVITATGHNYENYVSNNDATYTADGTETATCICGLTDTRTAEGSKLEYTYTDLDKTMYAKQTVNVRDLPSTDGNKLGGLSSAQEVKVLGQCNETSWYKIEFDGGVGYVSNNYIVAEKPVVEAVQQQTQQTQQTTQTEYPDCPYELFKVEFDGSAFYWYSNGQASGFQDALNQISAYMSENQMYGYGSIWEWQWDGGDVGKYKPIYIYQNESVRGGNGYMIVDKCIVYLP